MTNMLPNDAFRDARHFYRLRFLFVGSLILIASALAAFAVLMPAYVVVQGERADSDTETAAMLEADTDRAGLAKARVLTKEFRAFATSTTTLVPLLEEVLAMRPQGVFVERIDVERGESGIIVLSGRVSSRDNLNTYKTKLEENPRFESVTIPLGALAGTEGGRFTLTVRGSL